MAATYASLGVCFGVTAKLGPLANSDVWAELSGVFDKLITHFCLLCGGAIELVDEMEVEGAEGVLSAVVVVVELVVVEVVTADVVVVLLSYLFN